MPWKLPPLALPEGSARLTYCASPTYPLRTSAAARAVTAPRREPCPVLFAMVPPSQPMPRRRRSERPRRMAATTFGEMYCRKGATCRDLPTSTAGAGGRCGHCSSLVGRSASADPKSDAERICAHQRPLEAGLSPKRGDARSFLASSGSRPEWCHLLVVRSRPGACVCPAASVHFLWCRLGRCTCLTPAFVTGSVCTVEFPMSEPVSPWRDGYGNGPGCVAAVNSPARTDSHGPDTARRPRSARRHADPQPPTRPSRQLDKTRVGGSTSMRSRSC